MNKWFYMVVIIFFPTILTINFGYNFYDKHYISNDVIYPVLLNKTHFSCDSGNKLLSMNKINDDYCDCADGADENSK